MIFKAPGTLPINTKGVKYLAPGEASLSTITPVDGIDAVGVTNNFPNGIIVQGGIQTDEINVSNEADISRLNVINGADIGGDLKLSSDTQLLHGAKFRTRVDGALQRREYWDGSKWVEGDTIGE
jgi:hypothetical protein